MKIGGCLMKKKGIDWYFWGPGTAMVVIVLLIFTQSTKLPNGEYIFARNPFTYFLVGLMIVCMILLIFGKVKESMGGKINGKTVLYTAIAVPIVTVVVYFINN
jgi:hypothetical protein